MGVGLQFRREYLRCCAIRKHENIFRPRARSSAHIMECSRYMLSYDFVRVTMRGSLFLHRPGAWPIRKVIKCRSVNPVCMKLTVRPMTERKARTDNGMFHDCWADWLLQRNHA